MLFEREHAFESISITLFYFLKGKKGCSKEISLMSTLTCFHIECASGLWKVCSISHIYLQVSL